MMTDGKEREAEACEINAANESPAEWVLCPLREDAAMSTPDDARYLALFRDKAIVERFKQQRTGVPEADLVRLGLAHAGVTSWEWHVKTGGLDIDVSDNDDLSEFRLCEESTTWEKLVHESDRERLLEALERFVETGYVSFDCFFRLATVIPRWVHARDVFFLLDTDREPSSVLGLFFDVTESQIAKDHLYWGKELPEDEAEDKFNWHRMLSELERHEDEADRIDETRYLSDDVFSLLMILSDIPAFRKDADLAYTEINSAFERLVGLSSQEILKLSDEDLWGKEASENLERLCKRALSGESVRGRQVRSVNGEPLSFFDKVYPDWDSSGRISGVRGIMFCVGPEGTLAGTEDRVDSQRTSAHMRSLYQKIHLAAQTNSIVLLTGETGSGKDHFARRIHDLSRRADEPFEILNCAALPKDLAESELFGYEPGAFTGAKGRKRGVLEVAGSGTVVLDEIGDMPLELQSKLLTFLDTRCFKRLGGEKDIQCRARIIATTNADLKQAVAEGGFRKDLYYRINVFSIQVPPLRQRPEEIPSIVRGLMTTLARSLELERVPELDGFAMKKLLAYHWPGNVRELGNVLESAIAHTVGAQFGADHIIFDTEEETWPGEDSPQITPSSALLRGVDIPMGKAGTDVSKAERSALPVPLSTRWRKYGYE